MSKSMMVNEVSAGAYGYADIAVDECDPLTILIAMEDSDDSSGISLYPSQSAFLNTQCKERTKK